MTPTPEPTPRTPERYHCFKPEYGFAVYLPDTGGIEFTQVFAEATEATKEDWSDALGMELVHFQFVPAAIYIEKLEREGIQLKKELEEARRDTPTADAVIWREACNKAEAERDHHKLRAEEWQKMTGELVVLLRQSPRPENNTAWCREWTRASDAALSRFNTLNQKSQCPSPNTSNE